MTHPKEFAEGLSIGIIMDGNGRWAKNRGLPRTAGHKKGAKVFKDIANYCDELGVASVYFYAFSTENWKRPLEEVGAIMKLFAQYLIEGFDYKNRNIRIKFLGDRTALDPKLQKMMNELEGDSACKTGMTLNIAINYGGRPEIVRAAQQLAAKAAAGEIRPEDINEQMMSDAMYTAGQKDPDFILRPSGEKRLSNFMLWFEKYSLASSCCNCGKLNWIFVILKKCNIKTHSVSSSIAVTLKNTNAATRSSTSKVTGIF